MWWVGASRGARLLVERLQVQAVDESRLNAIQIGRMWRREPERARMPTDPRHAGSSPLAPEAHHHHSQSLRVLTRSRVLTTALLAVANRQTTDASRSANSCDTIARCALQRANPTPIYNKIALNQRPVLSDSCKCERERTESHSPITSKPSSSR